MSAVGSIMTNTGALQALNSISTTSNLNNTLEGEMSSGLSINSPADNPAGYITAQGFTSQLNGITQAISNANQGVSLLQTAQGAITQQIGVVQQLNSIAVQAANGTQTSAEAQSLQNVVGQLTGQVSTIANQTQFNDISLLNGSFSGVQFQVGANEGQTQSLSIGNTSAAAIGMNATTADTTNVYKTGANAGSAVLSVGALATTNGAFTKTAAAADDTTVTGPTGGTASFAVTSNSESAASLANSINGISGTTGVQAQATTSVTLKATGTSFAFTIQAGTGSGGTSSGIGKAQTIDASSAAQLVSQINGQTSTSGITASINSSSNLVLTQASGQNINISAVTAGSLSTTSTTAADVKTLNSATPTAGVNGPPAPSRARFSCSPAVLSPSAAAPLRSAVHRRSVRARLPRSARWLTSMSAPPAARIRRSTS